MISDPLVDYVALKQVIQDEYSLAVVDLSFMPVGEDGCLYRFSADGRRYVAKLVGVRRKTDSGEIERSLLAVTRLSQLAGFEFVVPPIPTIQQRYVTDFDGYTLVLYPYIDGETQSDRLMSQEELASLGTYVGRLHSVDASLFGELSSDIFDIHSVTPLTGYLENLPEWEHDARMNQAYTLLQPWKAKLIEEIERYTKLASILTTKKRRFVVTHGDITPGNIFFSNQHIHVVDWEGLRLNLPECDVNIFSDSKHLPYFLPPYLHETKTTLEMDAFAFFKYKWDLEGITERLALLLDNTTTAAQQNHELMELASELEGHTWLERGLAKIETELRKYA